MLCAAGSDSDGATASLCCGFRPLSGVAVDSEAQVTELAAGESAAFVLAEPPNDAALLATFRQRWNTVANGVKTGIVQGDSKGLGKSGDAAYIADMSGQTWTTGAAGSATEFQPESCS